MERKTPSVEPTALDIEMELLRMEDEHAERAMTDMAATLVSDDTALD